MPFSVDDNVRFYASFDYVLSVYVLFRVYENLHSLGDNHGRRKETARIR